MKNFLSFTIAILLALPGTTFGNTSPAQTLRELRANQKVNKGPKLAPDLEEMLEQDDESQSTSLTLGKIRENRLEQKAQRKGQNRSALGAVKIKGVTIPSTEVAAEEKQTFIVQMEGSTPDVVMQEKLALLGGRISRKLDQTGLIVIEAPRNAIRQIAAESSIAYISPDRVVSSFGHVNYTIGFLNPGINDAGDTNPSTWLVGTGSRVAVIDSGIQPDHKLTTNGPTYSKVYYQKDFTGQAINGDPYGHGSHVATLLSGTYVSSTYDYEGSAPGAEEISLRVLNDLGLGSVSNVIAALDWCVANKAAYNIRVINMSLGTPAKDSYKTDPLCLAARRAWNAGIVVVAAAGNVGKDLLGNKLYGGIHSPGIEPSIITVGAANTYGLRP